MTHAERVRVRPGQQTPLKAKATAVSNAVQGADAPSPIAQCSGLATGQPSKRSVMFEEQECMSANLVPQSSGMQPFHAGAPSLTEIARPFIVMVCEEFAKALVNVMSAHASAHIVPAVSLRVCSDGTASREEALHVLVEEVQSNLSVDEADPGYCLADETDMEHVEAGFPSQDESMEEDPLDVQPLFDPMLPPSADSDFKPKIGLVGTSGADFEGLRHRYPQLHLTIVQADALSDVRRFGHCQRIIALREEIAPGTDALLSRELRHRFIRLEGGINGIKAQLDAWLASPGSIAAGSRRRMPFGGTKGNAASKMDRQSRYPKWAGDAG